MYEIGKHAEFYRAYMPRERGPLPMTITLATISRCGSWSTWSAPPARSPGRRSPRGAPMRQLSLRSPKGADTEGAGGISKAPDRASGGWLNRSRLQTQSSYY